MQLGLQQRGRVCSAIGQYGPQCLAVTSADNHRTRQRHIVLQLHRNLLADERLEEGEEERLWGQQDNRARGESELDPRLPPVKAGERNELAGERLTILVPS